MPFQPQVPPSPSNTQQPKKPWYQTIEGWKAVFEIVAIPFAIWYAVITYFQWRDLRGNFQIDQRAWVGIVAISPDEPEESDGEFSFKDLWISMRNSGKTPALRMSAENLKIVRQPDRDPSPDYDALREGVPGVTNININVEQPLRNGVLAPNSETKISFMPTIRRYTFRGNGIATYFVGKLTYDDMFPSTPRHSTTFCIMHSGKGVFIACPSGNRMD